MKEPPTDRPPAGCTLGLAYAAATGAVYRFTCANTGDEGRNVWETRLLTGKWQVIGREQLPMVPAEGIRIAADPVLGGLLTVSPVGTRPFSFRTREWTSVPARAEMDVCFRPLPYLSKARCALCVACRVVARLERPKKELPEVQSWLFHSQQQRLERVQTAVRPERTIAGASPTIPSTTWRCSAVGRRVTQAAGRT